MSTEISFDTAHLPDGELRALMRFALAMAKRLDKHVYCNHCGGAVLDIQAHIGGVTLLPCGDMLLSLERPSPVPPKVNPFRIRTLRDKEKDT